MEDDRLRCFRGHGSHQRTVLAVGPQGGQLRRSNFRDDWVQAGKAAGVRAELHFHDLRHTGRCEPSRRRPLD
ncbi:phage integrase family protein [Streptomyces sp. S1D4-23]|nr:phage integrase family protein [Streptomyces sp. RLB3-6]QDO12063.1 phage integrase family protein [Streptomyces sp. S1D4-23]